eukprot:sb/3476605/
MYICNKDNIPSGPDLPKPRFTGQTLSPEHLGKSGSDCLNDANTKAEGLRKTLDFKNSEVENSYHVSYRHCLLYSVLSISLSLSLTLSHSLSLSLYLSLSLSLSLYLSLSFSHRIF